MIIGIVKPIGWVGVNSDGTYKRQLRHVWDSRGRAPHGPIQVYKSEKNARRYSGCAIVKEVFVND